MKDYGHSHPDNGIELNELIPMLQCGDMDSQRTLPMSALGRSLPVADLDPSRQSVRMGYTQRCADLILLARVLEKYSLKRSSYHAYSFD